MKPPTISSISFVIYSWGPCSGRFVPRENPIIINTSWVSSFHVQYPLVICYSLRTGSHGPVEILDFPIKNGGSVHSYVSLPEVKYPIKSHKTTIFLWFSYGFPMVYQSLVGWFGTSRGSNCHDFHHFRESQRYDGGQGTDCVGNYGGAPVWNR